LFTQHISENDTRDHIEVCPEAGVIVQRIADRISTDGGMALIADYGHDGNKTDTFRVSVYNLCTLLVSELISFAFRFLINILSPWRFLFNW